MIIIFICVLPKRLELLRLTTIDPKSIAATNYAKGAIVGGTNLLQSCTSTIKVLLSLRPDSNQRVLTDPDYKSGAINHYATKAVRKGEDGCVDNSFYDWHYLGEYFPTPIISASIHSRTMDIIIPQSTYS